MTKIIEFIQKIPYAAVNAVGAVLMLLTLFSEGLAACGVLAVILVIIAGELIIPLILLLVVNIASFNAVYNDRTVPGVILTVLGGGLGAMLALGDTGDNFPAHRAVRCICLIQVWLIAWLAEGFILYKSGVI